MDEEVIRDPYTPVKSKRMGDVSNSPGKKESRGLMSILSPSKVAEQRARRNESNTETEQEATTPLLQSPMRKDTQKSSPSKITAKLKRLSPLKSAGNFSPKSGFSKSSSVSSSGFQLINSRQPTSDSLFSQIQPPQPIERPVLPLLNEEETANANDSRIGDFTVDFTDAMTTIDDTELLGNIYTEPSFPSYQLDSGSQSDDVFYSLSEGESNQLPITSQKTNNKKTSSSYITTSNSSADYESSSNTTKRAHEKNIRDSQRLSLGYFRESIIEDESPIKKSTYINFSDLSIPQESESSIMQVVHSDHSSEQRLSREPFKVFEDNSETQANSNSQSFSYSTSDRGSSVHGPGSVNDRSNNNTSSSGSTSSRKRLVLQPIKNRSDTSSGKKLNFYESSESLDETEQGEARITKITSADISAVLKESSIPGEESEIAISRIDEEDEEDENLNETQIEHKATLVKLVKQSPNADIVSLNPPSFILEDHSINLFNSGTSDESLPLSIKKPERESKVSGSYVDKGTRFTRSSSLYSFRKTLPGTTNLLKSHPEHPMKRSNSKKNIHTNTSPSPSQSGRFNAGSSHIQPASMNAGYYDLHNLMKLDRAYVKKPALNNSSQSGEDDDSMNSFHTANRDYISPLENSSDSSNDSSIYYQGEDAVWRRQDKESDRTFHYHKQRLGGEYCQKDVALLLVLISILIPPFWFLIAFGILDKRVGKIPKVYKIISGALAAFVTIGAVVGIGVGFGYGTTH